MIDFKAIEEDNLSLGILSKAPIQEAVIGFYHSLSINLDATERLDLLRSTFSSYTWQGLSPLVFQTTISQNKGEFESRAEHKLGTEPERFVGRSENSNLVLIVEKEQFAVAMQSPYTSWDDFSRRAVELWEFYRVAFGVQANNYGLRYINRLSLDLTLSEYLKPEQLPKPVHVELRPLNYTSLSRQAIIGTPFAVQTMVQFEPTAPIDTFGDDMSSVSGALLLDIAILPLKAAPHTEGLGNSLAKLRALKNLFFRSTLNPTIIEHYR